jgi:two-component system chemotaxis response regulator CheB
VLVVDDSASVRGILTRSLSGDPAIEVVGAAANGAIGLARIEQLSPQVVTLDVEMPEMNGLEMLKKLREKNPDVIVIMVSTLTAPGAATTLDALPLGADDYVAKPSSGSVDQCMAQLQLELLPKVKQFFSSDPRSVGRYTPGQTKFAGAIQGLAPRRDVLAIGVSTGGPQALSTIVPKLPVPFPCPILVVQHMPPLFTKLLAERLQSLTDLVVEEAEQGSPVRTGKILIAPGGSHMRVKQSESSVIIVLDQSVPRNSCRPSVDVLFESVNEVYGKNSIAAVLTGMGQDGLRGAELLKASGAHILAQDESTSVVWGMPGFVVKAGLADAVLPLDSIVQHIANQLQHSSKRAAVRK